MRHAFWIAALLLASSSTALAEGPEDAPPPGAPPPGEPQPIMTPTYDEQPPPGQYPAEQQPSGPEPTGVEGRGIEYGLHIMVPIFFKDFINPGIGLQLRAGWEFGSGFTAELNIGGMINGYPSSAEFEERPGEIFEGQSNLWIGAGIRYMFFNPSAFVPMVGAGLKVNVWNLCVESASNSLVCSGDSEVALGLNGMVGAAYEISPYVAIEAGLQVELTGGMSAFPNGAMYLLPFIGGTLYY